MLVARALPPVRGGRVVASATACAAPGLGDLYVVGRMADAAGRRPTWLDERMTRAGGYADAFSETGGVTAAGTRELQAANESLANPAAASRHATEPREARRLPAWRRQSTDLR